MKPLIGISCCTKSFGLYGTPNHAASDTYVRAVDQVMGAVPVLVPANGDAADIDTPLLGVLLSAGTEMPAALRALDDRLGGAIKRTLDRADFRGARDTISRARRISSRVAGDSIPVFRRIRAIVS